MALNLPDLCYHTWAQFCAEWRVAGKEDCRVCGSRVWGVLLLTWVTLTLAYLNADWNTDITVPNLPGRTEMRMHARLLETRGWAEQHHRSKSEREGERECSMFRPADLSFPSSSSVSLPANAEWRWSSDSPCVSSTGEISPHPGLTEAMTAERSCEFRETRPAGRAWNPGAQSNTERGAATSLGDLRSAPDLLAPVRGGYCAARSKQLHLLRGLARRRRDLDYHGACSLFTLICWKVVKTLGEGDVWPRVRDRLVAAACSWRDWVCSAAWSRDAFGWPRGASQVRGWLSPEQNSRAPWSSVFVCEVKAARSLLKWQSCKNTQTWCVY